MNWEKLRANTKILVGMVAVLWVIGLINIALGNSLSLLGVRPRSLMGLLGIVLAPLLHNGWSHLVSNTLPLVALAALILVRDRDEFLVATLMSWLVSGIGVWLFGAANSVHVGASGVIFGYLGFLLLRGVFDRSLISMALALLVAVAYGYMLWGVLPTNPAVSWLGHLFGFVGGGLAARLVAPE